jgi:hypothetical protein
MPYVHTGIGDKKMCFTDEELDYQEQDFAQANAEIESAYGRQEISRQERNRQYRRLDILRSVAPAYREREALKATRH